MSVVKMVPMPSSQFTVKATQKYPSKRMKSSMHAREQSKRRHYEKTMKIITERRNQQNPHNEIRFSKLKKPTEIAHEKITNNDV